MELEAELGMALCREGGVGVELEAELGMALCREGGVGVELEAELGMALCREGGVGVELESELGMALCREGGVGVELESESEEAELLSLGMGMAPVWEGGSLWLELEYGLAPALALFARELRKEEVSDTASANTLRTSSGKTCRLITGTFSASVDPCHSNSLSSW